jgi:hypothetical protein
VSNGASTSASNIRQQLRQWEVAQSLEGSEPLLRDLVGSPADRPNLLVRAQASSQDRDILQFNSLEGDDTVQNQDGDFAGQLLANESLLLPGSLIELRYGRLGFDPVMALLSPRPDPQNPEYLTLRSSLDISTA